MEDHQIIETLSKYVLALGPEALTVVAVIALGYIPRFVPGVPHKYIPLFCIMVGPVVYPFLGDRNKIAFETTNPVVAQVLIGLVLGVVAWATHDQVIGRLEGFIKGKIHKRPDYVGPDSVTDQDTGSTTK